MGRFTRPSHPAFPSYPSTRPQRSWLLRHIRIYTFNCIWKSIRCFSFFCQVINDSVLIEKVFFHQPLVTGSFLTCQSIRIKSHCERQWGVGTRCFRHGYRDSFHNIWKHITTCLIAVSHHYLGSNHGRGKWESCQWLGVRRWFKTGTVVSSTTYNRLVTI